MATYTVTYNGNGSTGGTVPVDGSSPYAAGATVTVLGNTGSLVKTGASFIGWGTATTGGTQYQPTQTFIINANTTLYAQWSVGGASIPYNPSGTDPSGNEISTLQYFGGMIAGILLVTDGQYPGIKSYWMRGHNTTTGLYVAWQAPMIDYNAIFAPVQGSGSLSSIVWLGYTYK